MNYQQLFLVLPKPHATWTIEDTKTWLNFIGLSSLQARFESASIDGSIIDALTQSDFKDELQITSRIIIKKLMNWINEGIPQFDEYVSNHPLSLPTPPPLPFKTQSLPAPPKATQEKQQSRPKDRKPTQPPKRQQPIQLIIHQLEQSQASNYCLKEQGTSIGRHAHNGIVILDEFVSRNHAEIIFKNNQYFIFDLGSSSGTFIKICEKMEIQNGMVLEMGSNQFEVELGDNLILNVIEGTNSGQVYQLEGTNQYSIGRKQSNQISFPDDQHLSGIHSKIFTIRGAWFIQDIATTNGTWLRLSHQGQRSEPFLLQDKSQFKLSSNLIYECRITGSNNRRTFKGQEKCLVCRNADKDTIIMPCKHAAGCYACLSKVEECPICQTAVQNLLKMYTA